MITVAFGIGVNFYSYIERLDSIIQIDFFCDNKKERWDQYLMGDLRICISPSSIKEMENPCVIITAEKETSKCAIEKQCDEMFIPHIRAEEVLNSKKLKPVSVSWPQEIQKRRIHKFIELLVHGTTECNFHCEYCYVWRKEEFHHGTESSGYSAARIRNALSARRLGGICHINLCALGETLLAKGIEDIIYELAAEGHFVSVITNGTISSKINQILLFPKEIQERIFFKLSFHYMELKRTGLADVFWKNADAIKNSKCSYSIEITPSDLLLDQLTEIKESFRIHADGAMPHITFTRDAAKEELDLYSGLTLEEYKNTWNQFESDLFTLKSDLYQKKIKENCYAGCWSYRINLVNGNIQSCYQQEISGTIFDDPNENLPLRTVKKNCALGYCFNNHAFLAWGDVPSIQCKNYLAMRDRTDRNGAAWIRQPYRAVMSQKLYENNYEYINRWPDYEKLYEKKRKAAFLLFNSPDYGNLGDHAIAYSERRYFRELFPDREVIEISCKQYILENISIKNAVKKDDIILITGGGYIGSMWTWLEDLALNIVKNFPDHKIIFLPQTIRFEKGSYGAYERELFLDTVSSHRDVMFFARDNHSLKFMEHFGMKKSNYGLAVDMAAMLNLDSLKGNKGEKVFVCLRDDKESRLENKSGIFRMLYDTFGESVECFSTVTDEEVNLFNREKRLTELWTKIAKAKLMITDRLHAMIFSLLLGIPCIIFDNKTGKVSEAYDIFGDGNNIIKCDHLEDFEKAIHMEMPKEITIDRKKIDERQRTLKEYLRGHCFV